MSLSTHLHEVEHFIQWQSPCKDHLVACIEDGLIIECFRLSQHADVFATLATACKTAVLLDDDIAPVPLLTRILVYAKRQKRHKQWTYLLRRLTLVFT